MSMLTLFVFDMGYTNRFDMGSQPENTVLNLKFGGKTWFIMVTYLEHLENIISDQPVAISTQLYRNIFFKAGGGIGGNRILNSVFHLGGIHIQSKRLDTVLFCQTMIY